MADFGRIRERICELAGRRKNVTLAEIEWVMNQLGRSGYHVSARKTLHAYLYVVGDAVVGKARFAVCPHNKGAKQIKSCYVDEFLNAMIKLGLYED
jgi:hypothetical protein